MGICPGCPWRSGSSLMTATVSPVFRVGSVVGGLSVQQIDCHYAGHPPLPANGRAHGRDDRVRHRVACHAAHGDPRASGPRGRRAPSDPCQGFPRGFPGLGLRGFRGFVAAGALADFASWRARFFLLLGFPTGGFGPRAGVSAPSGRARGAGLCLRGSGLSGSGARCFARGPGGLPPASGSCLRTAGCGAVC